jgi:hypothetical protein
VSFTDARRTTGARIWWRGPYSDFEISRRLTISKKTLEKTLKNRNPLVEGYGSVFQKGVLIPIKMGHKLGHEVENLPHKYFNKETI